MLHSKFSPSQLPRIVICPGSVESTKDIAKTTSIYAQDGTTAHSMTEECLTLNEHTIPDLTKKKFNMAPDYEDAVQEVLDWVSALKLKHAECENMYEVIEQKVYLTSYAEHTGCELLCDVYGTLDYSLVVPEEELLYVIDWKFGAGEEVYPESEQLKAYALGRLAALTKVKIKHVILVIGQPRLYSGELFKMHETTPNSLFTWMQQSLIPALNNSQSKHPIFQPSAKSCRWCARKNFCKYRKNQALKAAASVFAIHAKLPDKTDEEELAEFLYQIPDLKKYISDIELYAHNIILNGKELPGFKLVAGRSIRKWGNETAAKKYYVELDDYDFEDLTITKFKSPTQIEKLVGKKNVTDEMKALVVKPPGKPTLVRETDRREPLIFETATEKFAKFVD